MNKEILALINDGYEPIYALDDMFDPDSYDRKFGFLLDAESIKESINGMNLYKYVFLRKDNEAILYEAQEVEPFEIAFDDILTAIALIRNSKENGGIRGGFGDLQRYLGEKINGQKIVIGPKVPDDIDIDDPCFDDDNHLCSLAYTTIVNMEIDDHFDDDFADISIGFAELSAKRGLPLPERHYSDHALIIFILGLESEFLGKQMPKNVQSFFREKLEYLVSIGDYDAIVCLGYEYYEGANGYPLDYKKSEELLLRAYSMREDPSVANTLGYIYYYGRANNGIPEKEKAFQYFAIAHFAGGYFEATYKLSDCYVKGYGTPVSEKAAYRLVDSIFNENYRLYMRGVDAKFADICLRIGGFYERGIALKKNPDLAFLMYHLARVAIKKRLQNPVEYPGDRSVAISIFKSIMRIEKENDYAELDRKIDKDGYVVKDMEFVFSHDDFNVSITPSIHEGYWQIETVRNVEGEFQEISMGYLRFVERTRSATFIAKFADEFHGFENYDWESMTLGDNALILYLRDGNKLRFNIEEDGLIYYPTCMDFLDKRYRLLSVKFSIDDEKEYFYLYQGSNDVKVGDKVFVDSKGKEASVTVFGIMNLYEDELPLPLSKIGLARKHHFA